MQNLGKVKFDPPKVPVIFVLGELLIFKLHKKHITQNIMFYVNIENAFLIFVYNINAL